MIRSKPMKRSPMRPGRPNTVPLSVRAQVIARANNACERCGTVAALELHHKVKRSQGGTHTDTNLVALCNACHLDVESHPAQAVVDGWSVQRKAVA